ncbi:MAG: hypothetical protein IPM54_01245 [Polyangiaceae bacterium]|nr:hypothetical protein [Polyangiaceae bacterium]
MRNVTSLLLACGLLVLSSNAFGATYQVGPGKAYSNLGEVASKLAPGDIVEVEGNQTYPGGVIFKKHGTAAQKITIRGLRVNGKRPVLSGGTNTIEAAGNHYIFEGLDLTGGSSRCFFHHADDIVLRDSVVHHCPKQGILGADQGSGSLLLEYTEVHHCGDGTKSHQIYMSTNENDYPGSVFRMQYCYLHDGNGGHGVKSRAERNEIYYNWLEGAVIHELRAHRAGSCGRCVERQGPRRLRRRRQRAAQEEYRIRRPVRRRRDRRYEWALSLREQHRDHAGRWERGVPALRRDRERRGP